MDKNCLSYWFPIIDGAGIPVPKTEIVNTDVELIQLCDGEEPPGLKLFLSELQEAVLNFGTPCFLRTGQGSGKHLWDRTCYLTDDSYGTIAEHVTRLVEWSECVDMIGLAWNVWAVREFLPTKPLFKCTAYGNMPAVREFRYFVSDGEVCYSQPYWPIEAIEQGEPDNDDWHKLYPQLVSLTQDESSAIEEMAHRVSVVVPGQWSVDILDTERGWYVTDMAIAELSYGYDESRMI